MLKINIIGCGKVAKTLAYLWHQTSALKIGESTAIKTFDNTYCCLEGDNAACEKLKSIIETIGGHCFTVKSENKLVYHAASVFACNYLVALQELSIKAFEKSGVERDLAMKILEPIVKETTNNVFELGTANALTGPIKRGDVKLVSEQYNALQHWDNDAADVYKLLSKLSVELLNNKSSSGLTSTNLTTISELFSK